MLFYWKNPILGSWNEYYIFISFKSVTIKMNSHELKTILEQECEKGYCWVHLENYRNSPLVFILPSLLKSVYNYPKGVAIDPIIINIERIERT